MAERRTLGDAMTPEKIAFIRNKDEKAPQVQEKTVELRDPAPSEQTEAIPSRSRSRGRARPVEPQARELLDQVLVPVTMRLQHRTAQALKRAYLEQKLKHLRPDTLQQIGEEALVDWLIKAGYLD